MNTFYRKGLALAAKFSWPALFALLPILIFLIAFLNEDWISARSVDRLTKFYSTLLFFHVITLLNWALRSSFLAAALAIPYAFFALVIAVTGLPANICGFPTKARQSEAKIRLTEIFNRQSAALTGQGKPIPIEDMQIEMPGRSYYAYAMVDCITKKRGRVLEPEKWIPKEDVRQEIRSFLSAINVERECTEASRRYVVFAAGRISLDPKAPLDIWRVDDSARSLRNEQPGL